MNTVEKIIDFAEKIALEDKIEMDNLQKWEDYITPLFKTYCGRKFDLSYVSMYSKEDQKWLSAKRKEFYKNNLK